MIEMDMMMLFVLPWSAHYLVAICIDMYRMTHSDSLSFRQKLGSNRMKSWLHALALSVSNLLTVTLPISWFCSKWLNCTTSLLHILNGPFVLMFYMVLLDMMFYTSHRMFHWVGFLYRNVHRYHHKWYAPYAVSSMASHPVEHLIVNILSAILPIVIFPHTHKYWIYLYVMILPTGSALAHSGICGISDTHDLHHQYLRCNYGASISDRFNMDRMMGTYIASENELIAVAKIAEQPKTE